MGLLSALLTVGGEIIGGPIGASIGGSIGGAIDQSQASSKAEKAQVAAQQAAIAARQQAANQVTTLNQPYLSFGTGAVNALGPRLGIGSVAPTPLPFPNAPGGPAPVAANTNALAPSGSQVGPSVAGNALAPISLGDFGRSGGAPIAQDPANTITPPPMLVAPPESTAPQTVPLSTAGPAPATTPNALAPSSAAYPVSNGTDPGTFGDTTNPTQPGAYTAPTPFSYSLADYKASPGYQYQQDQALKATLAGASATGALQSGAAMKALQDRAQNIAYGDFTGERNFAANQNQLNVTNGLNAYDTNQNVYDNNRNYLTSRFDTQTGNLFKAANVGQTAAGVVSNADLGVAGANAGSQTAIGNAQAGNALQQANIGTTLGGNLGGIISSVAGAFGGGGTPLTLQTAPTSLGITPPQVNGSQIVNAPPTNPFGY